MSSTASTAGTASTATATTTSTAAQKAFQILYWVAGLALSGYASKALFDSGRQVASVLVFLLSIGALAFYWARWLAPSAGAAAPWPPYVTACPDFLTLVRVDVSGGAAPSSVCVDYVGVSTNGGILKADATVPVASLAPSYTFPVRKRGSGETPAAYKSAMCGAAAAAGLSWSTLCGDAVAPA
jgi:hypothetical protein